MKSIKRPPHCDNFMQRAKYTWKRLGESKKYSIRLSEETITENNLYYLKVRNPNFIRIAQPSKKVEGKEGHDWEMWVISRQQTIGLRIQAKKLNLDNMTYPELDRRAADYSSSKKYQVDLLIESSLRNPDKITRLPLYVFYNHWNSSIFSYNSNCYFHRQPSLMGCGLTLAHYVKSAIQNKKKDLASLSSKMYPWSCMFCHVPTLQVQGPISLAEQVYNFLYAKFGDNDVEYFKKELLLTENLPSYVEKMKETKLTNEEFEELKLDHIVLIIENEMAFY